MWLEKHNVTEHLKSWDDEVYISGTPTVDEIVFDINQKNVIENDLDNDVEEEREISMPFILEVKYLEVEVKYPRQQIS